MSSPTDLKTPEASALSRPLERVMRQVLAMKRAGDIDHLIRQVWDVLLTEEFDFVSCAFLLMDQERDWLTSYSVWDEKLADRFYNTANLPPQVRRLDNRLLVFSGQTSLQKAPTLYRDAVAAWRQGTVERHQLSAAEIDEIAHLNTQRYGGGPAAPVYPIRFHLHIPFAHGVFTLRSGRPDTDQFNDAQVGFLKRLVEILSVGYTRYREFLSLERESRVQRLRAEVQAMQQSDDITGLMGRLWEELHHSGTHFDYISIAVTDGEEDHVHLYAAVYRRFKNITSAYSLLKENIAPEVDLFYKPLPRPVWEQNRTDFVGVHRVENEQMPEYAERIKQLWQSHSIVRPPYALTMMAAPLPQGRLVTTQIQNAPQDPPGDYTPEDQEVLEAFAAALGLGFTRFFDFQRLERHNRQLAIERAVEQVRAEILRMEQSSDILAIVRLIWRQLTGLGYDFYRCSVTMFDEEGDLYFGYITGGLYEWISIPSTTPDLEVFDGQFFSHSFERRLSADGSPYRHELLDAWRQGTVYQVEMRHAADKEEYADFARRVYNIEINAAQMPDIAGLYVPFAHGVIGASLIDAGAQPFADAEIALFRRFGEAFSEGYSRFLELRQREIEGGVERLRAEVASMRQSSDIANVAVHLGQQLSALGLEFSTSTFSVIDEEAQQVHLYGIVTNEVWSEVGFTAPEYAVVDRSIIGELDSIEGPVYIKEVVPGFYFGYTREALEGSPTADPDQEPRIVHRNEAERRQSLERFRRNWGPDYPLEQVPLSAIRVPFSHGSIAIAHTKPDHFTQRDVDLVAAYAEALGLGFTRFQDFQRLERHNRQLAIERAVEQVRAEIMRMEQSSDILAIVRLIWRQLIELGYHLQRCSITMLDEERDLYWGYFATRRTEWLSMPSTTPNIELFDGQFYSHSLETRPGTGGGPYRQELIEAWRRGEVYRGGLRNAADKEEYAEFCRRVHAIEVDALKMPDMSYFYVPFAHGFFGGFLFDADKKSLAAEDIALFRRFGEAFSEGYSRFLELRQREVQRGVERLRAEVASMRQSSDIADVAVLLAQQLREHGLDFVASSFSVIDEEAQQVHLYAVVANDEEISKEIFTGSEHAIVDRSIIGELDFVEVPVFIKEIIPGFDFGYTRESLANSPIAAERGRGPRIARRSQAERQQNLELFKRRWRLNYSIEHIPSSVIRVPFSHGSIAISALQPDCFTQRDVDLVAAYADAISLGFTRFHDFQRLERHSRNLEIERAVGRVQIAVQNMKNSADLMPVIALLSEELQDLQLDYTWCTINIVDRQAQKLRLYGTSGWDQSSSQLLEWLSIATPSGQEQLSFSSDTMERIENEEGPFYITDIPGSRIKYANYLGAPLDSYHGRLHSIDKTTITRRNEEETVEACREYARRWKVDTWPEALMLRSVLRTPFAGGTIALTSTRPNHFDRRQGQVLERFAEAFSLGYTRYLDFRSLEQRNRQLEIERAIGRVQIAVQNMKNSTDLLPIIVLLSQELENLQLDYSWCTINIVNAEAQRLHIYGTIGSDHGYVEDTILEMAKESAQEELAFGTDTIEQIENRAGPFLFKDIPGQTGYTSYTSAPLDSFHGRLQQIKTTAIIRRDPKEARAISQEYARLWKVKQWPDQVMMRSILRTPFAGGTIALNSTRAEHFGQREAVVLERFAEAFSLGYTRYLDFRSLEQRNRQLEIERAIGRVQIAVQSMKNSTDIVPIITLLSQELQRLGLDYNWCSINIVDHQAQKVRIYGTFGADQPFDQLELWTELLRDSGQEERPFSSDSMEWIEYEEGPLYVSGIPGSQIEYAFYTTAPLDSYHGRLQQIKETTITSRSEAEAKAGSQEYIQRWKVDQWPDQLVLRSILRTPFTGGTIAISDMQPNHFDQRDARILERFAEAFSLGYARYLDFRDMEQRNRQLEVERAVERVQIAVQNMKNSADIIPVMPLLYKEMQHLGTDYSYFSVSIVDKAAKQVRVYSSSESFGPLAQEGHLTFVQKGFGPHIVEQLENEGDPILIGDPAWDDLLVYCMSASLDSYHGRLQQIEQTTITCRSEEEMHRLVLPELQKHWRAGRFADDFWPRSVIRVPFAGGTIALSDPRPDYYVQRDARILERFAEAFSLGYTRYLDFRRLEEQNRALEAASRIKSEFLANMSHELRTPMNAIINFAAMVLDGVCGEISEDVRDVVGEIDQNGERLLELINDVLDLSKIEAGAMHLERAPCDPAACAENAVAALEHDAREKGLALNLEVEDLPPILVDERRLTQHVLVNLVKNAIKFTQKGQITVGTRCQNGDVLFWVKDTGIGIPTAEQARIFETFHQVDGSITRQAEGTGLGLAIAQKFVELHRGRIWVESEENKGSTFNVAIPMKT